MVMMILLLVRQDKMETVMNERDSFRSRLDKAKQFFNSKREEDESRRAEADMVKAQLVPIRMLSHNCCHHS